MIILVLFYVSLFLDWWLEGKEKIEWPKEIVKQKRYPHHTVAGYRPRIVERKVGRR